MTNARHYGIDWLRIGAFAILILYHVAMVFSPWAWVVKWPEHAGWLTAPLALLTPWRLPLLFVVGGFATRRLIARGGSMTEFARGRTMRLLLPLAFALVALLPPEMWVRARQLGYAGSLARYWLVDGWQPFPAGRPGFPAWEHLWFLVYLWAYTMLAALVVGRIGMASIQAHGERWLRGQRLLWWPIAALVTARVALMFVFPETHLLLADWLGHAEYLPMFVFGLVLGGSPALWMEIDRVRSAVGVAATAGIVVMIVELRYPGTTIPPHAVAVVDRAAQVAMAWAVVLIALRLADRHWNRDGRWRARLAEAVFPAYLVHHPAIVVVSAWLIPTGIGAGAAFAIVLATTAAACVAAATLARRSAWLGPLLGVGALPIGRPARHAATVGQRRD